MAIIGYARVSTKAQSLDSQIKQLEQYAATSKKELMLVTEVGSAGPKATTRHRRTEFLKMLSFAKETGAPIVVTNIDRLTRNLEDVKLIADCGVEIIEIPKGVVSIARLTEDAKQAEAEWRKCQEKNIATVLLKQVERAENALKSSYPYVKGKEIEYAARMFNCMTHGKLSENVFVGYMNDAWSLYGPLGHRGPEHWEDMTKADAVNAATIAYKLYKKLPTNLDSYGQFRGITLLKEKVEALLNSNPNKLNQDE